MKISVLIPTLGERILELRTLFNSIVNQTYNNIEVVVISQANHESVKILINQFKELNIKQICLKKRGLSRARNIGLSQCKGDLIILSDDDCWYEKNAFKNILRIFRENNKIDILLTQIYSPQQNKFYKKYSSKQGFINNKYKLMSKSSIEIAFIKNRIKFTFDERFGLGSTFVCGEEVDFLLKNFKRNTIYYLPKITVFHPFKSHISSQEQIFAKGALYGKHFSLPFCYLVLLRDLIRKKENNFKNFFEGYARVKMDKFAKYKNGEQK